ncbi:hypothetical protein LSUE1_G007416 [Lachnellula suecica]|uniref:DUF7907 domain-containing protein n=1 Tax=Lachnellula suecica TaxID=602035 RepID=A0A8T9C7N6_9HELO|nr:hypothetical protein LSUE1_G007416 [Lachnellula suecica]
MVSMRNLALAASTIVGFTSAAPTMEARTTETYTPGTLNNTQEFYIKMSVTSGDTSFNNKYLEAYHTGAGLADPTFTNETDARVPSFLNGTSLQFDVGDFPFSPNAYLGDSNYARWEPVTIGTGYSTGWVNNATAGGLVVQDEAFAGWIVCEWYHGVNAPQLFALITGYATDLDDIPSSCALVNLVPEFF